MNEQPLKSRSGQRPGRWLFVGIAVGLLVALTLGIGSLLFVRAWNSSKSSARKSGTTSNTVRSGENATPEEAHSSDRAKKSSRGVANDNFADRLPLETPGHAAA